MATLRPTGARSDAVRETIDSTVRARSSLHRQAQTPVLTCLVRNDDLADMVAAVAPSDVPGWFTPDIAILELAVTAFDLASAAGSAPLVYEGI